MHLHHSAKILPLSSKIYVLIKKILFFSFLFKLNLLCYYELLVQNFSQVNRIKQEEAIVSLMEHSAASYLSIYHFEC